MRRAKRRSAWLFSAAVALGVFGAAAASPSPAFAQRYWAPARTETLSPKDTATEKRLDEEVGDFERKGRYFESLSSAEQLLELRTRLLGPDHTDTLLAAVYAAANYLRIAEFGRAEALYRRVIGVLERAGMPAWRFSIEIESLARTYRDMGDFRRSEEQYYRLLAEESIHGDSSFALECLAEMYKVKGDLRKAEAAYYRLMTEREGANAHHRASGWSYDEPAFGTALAELADLYRITGAFARAEPYFTRAVAILDARPGIAERPLAEALNHQALLYQDMRTPARAEPILLRALAIREKEYGQAHPRTAEVVYNLGSTYAEMGDKTKATAHYNRAITILKNSFGPDHPRVIEGLAALEALAVAEGNYDAALTMRTEAAAAEDKKLTRLLTVGSEEEKRGFVASLDPSTDRSISLHALALPSSQSAAALALTTILRRKARVLDAMTDSLAILRKELTAGDRALLGQLEKVYAGLSARSPLVDSAPATGGASSRGATPPSGGAPARDRLSEAALLDEKAKLEAEVSRRSSAFRADQRPVILADVQALLPADTALVELALYRPAYSPPPPKEARADEPRLDASEPRERARKGRADAPRYIAYVLRSRGDIGFADLGEAAPIDSAVVELRAALSDPVRDPKRLARDLDDRTMAKIRPLLGGATRVYLSPEGALNLVPFGALLDTDQRYLVERTSFTYVASGRDLLRLDKPAASRQGAVVIANPAFDDSGSGPIASVGIVETCADCRGKRSADMATMTFSPLTGTAGEARAIGAKIEGARLITGPSATETEVKGVAGPRILHIATHGFFLPKRARKEAMQRGHGLEELDRYRAATIPDENPLLRAGLIFAGADHRVSGSDDGVLTAAEASGLDLYGTKLVVLSACETGVGDATPGDGVQGLRRALVMAGAETQVMSLWKLDDEATRDLMVAYYDGLKAGAGRSDAMRSAQLALLGKKATDHPYYWAGFIVSGDASPLPAETGDGARAKVAPGPRGCACEIGDPEGQRTRVGAAELGLSLLVAAALARLGRRKRLTAAKTSPMSARATVGSAT